MQIRCPSSTVKLEFTKDQSTLPRCGVFVCVCVYIYIYMCVCVCVNSVSVHPLGWIRLLYVYINSHLIILGKVSDPL